MKYRVAGMVVVILASLSMSVLASDTKWVQAFTNITGEDLGAVVNWLQRAGHITSYERFTTSEGDPAFRLIGRDFRCVVYMNGKTTDSSGGTAYASLTLYAGFTMSRGPSCATINDWNEGWLRLSRAYVDDDGYACIWCDLRLKGGVAEDAIKEWFLFFLQKTVPDFMKHIGR